MATLKTTTTGASAFFQAILDHITGDAGTPGRDWETIIDDRDAGGLGMVVVKNTGSGGESQVFVGFKLHSVGDGTRYFLGMQVYTDYNVGDPFEGNPLGSGYFDSNYWFVACTPLYSGATKLFCYSSKERIVIVSAIGGSYFTCYIGRFKPYAYPHEYPFPLVCITPAHYCHYGLYTTYGFTKPYLVHPYSGVEFDVIGEIGGVANPNVLYNRTSLLDDTDYRSRVMKVCTPGNEWQHVYIPATQAGLVGSIVYKSGAPTVLFPVVVRKYENVDVYGELDGVFHAPNVTNTPESEIVVGESLYTLFPQLNLTAGGLYIAVLEY